MTQSKVSIVIPCYNKVEWIGDMLNSIIAQTWDNIEVLLVNDGSTDGTREVITEYDVLFKERGYEVNIIDQENQGLPAAVRNGMLQMTGDYFCTVDCDDELMPEYVSTMAGWLDGHPEYEWTTCGVAFRHEYGDKPEAIEYKFITTPDCIDRYMYVTKDARSSACIYMVRLSYIHSCRVIEHFLVEPRASQEPSIVIPLLIGKGKVKYFREPLYIRNFYSAYYWDKNPALDVIDHFSSYYNLRVGAINKLDINQKDKCIYISLAYLFKQRLILKYINEEEDINNVLGIINGMFNKNPKITVQDIRNYTHKIFFTALEDSIFNSGKQNILSEPNTGRVIGYGVLGKNGREYVRILNDMGTHIDILWDNAAEAGTQLYGLPVTKPVYDIVSKEDIVLVFPSKTPQATEIEHMLQNQGITNYYTFSQVCEYLAKLCFPQLYNDCLFIGNPILLKE